MYRNKVLLIILFPALVSLTACSKHDLAYYQNNLDAAKEKVAECEATVEEAFKSGDKEQVKAVLEDEECRAADRAHRNHKRELAKLEAKKREEERKRKKAEEEKAFQAEYEKQKSQLAGLSVEEFYAANKKCNQTFSFRSTPKCKAISDMKEGKESAEIEALIGKYPDGALEEFNKKSCKGMQFNEVYCDLSRRAVIKQRKDKVQYYLDNRNDLKAVFNKCQQQIQALNKAGKYRDATGVARTFRCKTVSNAAQKLRVFGFGRPIK